MVGRKVYQNMLKDRMKSAGGKLPRLAGLRLSAMRTSKMKALEENAGLRKELGMLSRFEKGAASSIATMGKLKRENLSLQIVAAGRTAAKMGEENKGLQVKMAEIDYKLKKTNDLKEKRELIRQHNAAAAKMSRNSIALDELESIRKKSGKLLYRQ